MSDTVLNLYFQPGATINQNRFYSIFSLLNTLVLQVRRRFQHSNIPDLSDAVLLLHFQPGATINPNGQNKKSLKKFVYESTIKICRTRPTLPDMPDKTNAVLTLYFQRAETINETRFYSIFSLMVTLIDKYEGDFSIKIFRT